MIDFKEPQSCEVNYRYINAYLIYFYIINLENLQTGSDKYSTQNRV